MIWIGLLVMFLTHLANGQDFDADEAERLRAAYQKHMLDRLSFDSHPPQTDSSLDYLGRWGWGQCDGVAAMGNYVFTGSGPTLLWLDVSDRRNPLIVWEAQADWILTNFIVRDSIGYVLVGGTNLLIVDFRNPLAPVIRSELPIIPGLLGLTVGDSLAFVKKYRGFIYCIDISNPSSPRIRAIIRETTSQWGELTISGHNLYVGDQNGYTEHIDVSNPDSARVTVLYNVTPLVIAAYAKDTLLLLGGYSSRLFIYSIKTPASPIRLSNAVVGNVAGITSITVRGDTAFAGTVEGRVVAVNIIDKRNPVILGTYTPTVTQPELSAGSLAAQDTVLFGSFWNGMTTFSIANPASMNVLSFFPTGYLSSKVVVKNGLAYVTSAYAGLWVVDVSDPTRPQRIGNIQTLGYSFDVVVDSTIAYISVNERGLLTIDISHPDTMVVLDTLALGAADALSKSGETVFVAHSGSGPETTVTIVNVNDPSNLRRVGRIPGDGYAVREITSRENIAFVATNRGLKIFDLSNPVIPQLLSTTFNSAVGVSVNGNLAYVRRGDTTYVLDITNLANPSILGRVWHPPPGSSGAWESVATTNNVFWANPVKFGIIDVASPSDPRVLFEVGTFWEGGIAVVQDTIYVTRADGVWIYRYNRGPTSVSEETSAIPDGLQLFPNYPNPFNAVTQLKFATTKQEEIQIDVYNLLGQRVRRAFTGVVSAGEHAIEFDASGLPSGVYFYRLQAHKSVKFGRMTIIK